MENHAVNILKVIGHVTNGIASVIEEERDYLTRPNTVVDIARPHFNFTQCDRSHSKDLVIFYLIRLKVFYLRTVKELKT